MRVLVTGGAGFIGSHIVDGLLEAGHEVFVVDNLSSGKRQNLPPEVPLHVGDVTDTAWLTHVMAEVKPEVVTHQAAQISVVRSVKEPQFDDHQNVIGLISVLEAARAQNPSPKVIFASSGGAVYGTPKSIPVPETAEIHPASPYGLTKAVGELYIRLYGELHGLRYTVLRYANVFGPRQNAEGEAGVCAIFTNRALAGESMQIFGDGTQTRDYVFVGDVARANVLAVDKGEGATVNIGSGVQTSTQTVFDRIKAASGYPGEVIHAPERPGEVQGIALDASLAGEILGWKPTVGFADGIDVTVKFCKEILDGIRTR
jgi:UDP-glucose 4-epimerase